MSRVGLIGAAVIGALLLAASPTLAAGPNGYRQLSLGGQLVRWLPHGQSNRITLRYRIADSEIDQPTAINCRRLRPPQSLLAASGLTLAAFRTALATAFQQWRDVADITFVEAAEGQPAEIVIGEQTDPTGFAFTNVELGEKTTGRVRPIIGASICLNPEKAWKIGYDGNLTVYDLVHTLTHEIGHVIGLDHPSGRGHMMSFRYSEERAGLSEGDRLGAVAIYGASRLRSLSAAETAPVPPGTNMVRQSVTTIIGRSIDGNSAE